MPTYEYECEVCAHHFEEFRSITADPLRKCPKCGKLKLRQIYGAGAAILFKGSGFYQTDYRSESYQSAAKADKEPAKDSAPSGDSSKETPRAPAAEKSDGGSKTSGKKAKSTPPVSDE